MRAAFHRRSTQLSRARYALFSSLPIFLAGSEARLARNPMRFKPLAVLSAAHRLYKRSIAVRKDGPCKGAFVVCALMCGGVEGRGGGGGAGGSHASQPTTSARSFVSFVQSNYRMAVHSYLYNYRIRPCSRDSTQRRN
jgi:hypothetical protein